MATRRESKAARRRVWRNRILAGAALLAIIVIIIVIAVSCGNKEKNKDKEIQDPSETEQMKEPTEPSETESLSPEEQYLKDQLDFHKIRRDVSKNVDFAALEQIDNQSYDYGFSADRDELNRPITVNWYLRNFGEYGGRYYVDTEEKVIYMTMDEGYEYGFTPEILDTYKEKGVKCTFFITEDFLNTNPELVQRMIDEGHEVGNHTCSHPSGGIPQIGMQAMFDDVKKLDDRLYNEFGYQMRLFRYPAGVQSERGDVLLKQMGYTPVFWSFCHTDYYVDDQPDPADALEACVQWLHPGAVYLLHAVSSTNTEILGDFIDRARAEGYEFGLPEDLVTEELY